MPIIITWPIIRRPFRSIVVTYVKNRFRNEPISRNTRPSTIKTTCPSRNRVQLVNWHSKRPFIWIDTMWRSIRIISLSNASKKVVRRLSPGRINFLGDETSQTFCSAGRSDLDWSIAGTEKEEQQSSFSDITPTLDKTTCRTWMRSTDVKWHAGTRHLVIERTTSARKRQR